MDLQEIKEKVIIALQCFYSNDAYLIDKNVHERALTFRLGMYLQILFSSWDVDCEYNKNIETFRTNKLLHIRCEQNGECRTCADIRSCTVFPDIIIHKRGTSENQLVIEAKCNANKTQKNNDLEKLQAYLDEPTLHYKYGLFIDFKESVDETIKSLCWLQPGEFTDAKQ